MATEAVGAITAKLHAAFGDTLSPRVLKRMDSIFALQVKTVMSVVTLVEVFERSEFDANARVKEYLDACLDKVREVTKRMVVLVKSKSATFDRRLDVEDDLEDEEEEEEEQEEEEEEEVRAPGRRGRLRARTDREPPQGVQQRGRGRGREREREREPRKRRGVPSATATRAQRRQPRSQSVGPQNRYRSSRIPRPSVGAVPEASSRRGRSRERDRGPPSGIPRRVTNADENPGMPSPTSRSARAESARKTLERAREAREESRRKVSRASSGNLTDNPGSDQPGSGSEESMSRRGRPRGQSIRERVHGNSRSRDRSREPPRNRGRALRIRDDLLSDDPENEPGSGHMLEPGSEAPPNSRAQSGYFGDRAPRSPRPSRVSGNNSPLRSRGRSPTGSVSSLSLADESNLPTYMQPTVSAKMKRSRSASSLDESPERARPSSPRPSGGARRRARSRSRSRRPSYRDDSVGSADEVGSGDDMEPSQRMRERLQLKLKKAEANKERIEAVKQRKLENQRRREAAVAEKRAAQEAKRAAAAEQRKQRHENAMLHGRSRSRGSLSDLLNDSRSPRGQPRSLEHSMADEPGAEPGSDAGRRTSRADRSDRALFLS